jgi:hypothetical protein
VQVAASVLQGASKLSWSIGAKIRGAAPKSCFMALYMKRLKLWSRRIGGGVGNLDEVARKSGFEQVPIDFASDLGLFT